MKKNKNSNRKIIRFLVTVISFAVFVGIGVFIAESIISYLGEGFAMGEYFLWLLIYLLVFYAAYFIHIIVHESGHLVFGLLTGYTFLSFRIGSLTVTKEGGKLRFARYSLAGTLGQCLLCPPEEKEGKIPFILYNLGGSAFNVILALICIALYAAFPSVPVLSVLLMCGFVVGLLTAATNGIPMQMGLVNNDGYNAVSLGKDA